MKRKILQNVSCFRKDSSTCNIFNTVRRISFLQRALLHRSRGLIPVSFHGIKSKKSNPASLKCREDAGRHLLAQRCSQLLIIIDLWLSSIKLDSGGGVFDEVPPPNMRACCGGGGKPEEEDGGVHLLIFLRQIIRHSPAFRNKFI